MEEGLHFPLHMQDNGEDFIIDREDDDATSPVYFSSADVDANGVRLKRRRRCGQCGPCQVKENCNKCNYCLRRDVLKQTCVYRKCIYLRAKPKPYSRPKDGNQMPGQFSKTLPSKVTSPPTAASFGDSMLSNFDVLDHAGLENHSRGSSQLENAKSKVSPRISEPFPLGIRPVLSGSNVPPYLPPPIPSSVSNIMNQHRVPGIPGILDHASTNLHCSSHQFVLPPTSSVTDIALGGQMRGPNSMLQQNNCAQKLSGLSFRETQAMRELNPYQSIMSGPINPGQQESSSSGSSSCLYPQGIVPPNMQDTHCMFGLSDRSPSGSLYFPSDSEMLRHLSALQMQPPYGYPSSRYGQNFSGPTFPSFSGIRMPPPPPPPPGPSFSFPSAGDHTHHGWPRIPQSFSNCEQMNQCPKNGSIPPASQTLGLDFPVVQERCTNINFKSPNLFMENSNPLPRLQRLGSVSMASDEMIRSTLLRPDSALSTDSGFISLNSDIECDISIDDCQMNARVRSDGQNVLCIEIGNMQKKEEKILTEDQQLQATTEIKMEPGIEKLCVKGTVCLKQDLGDEGIIRVDLPGTKVFLEPDVYLDDKLASYSCNLKELLEFIRKPISSKFFETDNKSSEPNYINDTAD